MGDGIGTCVFNKLAGSLVGGRGKPGDALGTGKGLLEVLDTGNDSLNVVVVLKVGDGRDDGVQGAGNGHPTTGHGTTAEVLAHGNGLCCWLNEFPEV